MMYIGMKIVSSILIFFLVIREGNADCHDLRHDCFSFNDDQCVGSYKQWAAHFCPYRCGYCPGVLTPACQDELRYCDEFANLCQQKEYIVYLRTNCRETCGLCTVPSQIHIQTGSSSGGGGGFGGYGHSVPHKPTGVQLVPKRTTISTEKTTTTAAATKTTTTTTSTTSTTAPTTTQMLVNGGWTDWNKWSTCSATCGIGIETRDRFCTNPAPANGGKHCVGESHQIKNCTIMECPEPIDGKWTYWHGWSKCSATCGAGTQSRQRFCAEPAPENGGKSCEGENIQSRKCAEWPCPDCGRTCPNGGIRSPDCTVCECSSLHLFGISIDDKNHPISEVSVSVHDSPYKSLTTTNSFGEYYLSGFCMQDIILLFHKEGYEEKITRPYRVNTTHWSADILLHSLVKPIVMKHPANKHRFVGQSASLCCKGEGYPNNISYEWYKDEKVLQGVGQNGTLHFTSLKKSDSGAYRCKVINKAGVTMSETANIYVSDISTDTCGPPKTKIQFLPSGCHALQNSVTVNQVNVGKCSGSECIKTGLVDNGTCEEWWPDHCCDVDTFKTIDVHCDDFTYPLRQIMSCRCRNCETPTVISGRAFGVVNNTEIPFSRGKILMDGEIKGYTSSSGYFSMMIPKEKKQITLTFAADIHNKFQSAIRVLTIRKGAQLSITVRIPLRPEPKKFNVDHGLNMQLGNIENEPPVASLSIPNNCLVTSNGSKYVGTAHAFIHFMDPRKMDDIDEFNGKLNYIDENGQSAALETYGMMTFDFEDNDGNPLHATSPIKTELDKSVFNYSVNNEGEPVVSTWILNPINGHWEEQSKFKSLSSATKRRLLDDKYVGRIPVSNVPTLAKTKVVTRNVISVNYDRPGGYYYIRSKTTTETLDELCFVRVMAYEDLSLSEVLKDTSIKVFTKDLNSNRFRGKMEISTKEDGIACVEMYCGSTIYILAENGGTKLMTADKHNVPSNFIYQNIDNGTTVKFDANVVYKGGVISNKMNSPVYLRSFFGKCGDPSFSNSAIQFAKPFEKPETLPIGAGSFAELNHRLSWYTRPVGDSRRRNCFIKVFIKTNDNSLQVIAKSYLQGADKSINESDIYGTYRSHPYWDETSNDRSKRAACIEYRCAGKVKEPVPRDAATFVHVKLVSKDKTVCTLDTWNPALNITQRRNGFTFLADPGSNYGASFGVYVRNRNKESVKSMCHSGAMGGSISNIMKPDKNPAIEMTCATLR